MTGGRKYLVNVTVFFVLTMAAIFLSELIAEIIPHGKEIYGFIFAVCMIPAAIFVNIRLPEDDASVRGTVVGMIILGVYMTAMVWFLEKKMNVPFRYAMLVTFASAMLLWDLRKVMKKKAQPPCSTDARGADDTRRKV